MYVSLIFLIGILSPLSTKCRGFASFCPLCRRSAMMTSPYTRPREIKTWPLTHFSASCTSFRLLYHPKIENTLYPSLSPVPPLLQNNEMESLFALMNKNLGLELIWLKKNEHLSYPNVIVNHTLKMHGNKYFLITYHMNWTSCIVFRWPTILHVPTCL